MDSVAVSSIVFALIFAGSLVGMGLRRALPVEHLGQDAKDSMRLAIGLVATMTGLVLGMLVSSAKSYYDGQKSKVTEMSTEVILLNSCLTAFGPDGDQIRSNAHQTVEAAIDRVWPKEKSSQSQLRPKNNDLFLAAELQSLVPKNDTQASAKAQATVLLQSLKRSNWLMFLESEQASIPPLLLIVVTSWLVTIFISFGIFAPPNPTVIATLIICALAASGAIFIILEMYSPFSGLLRISPAAVRDALDQMAVTR
jgi:Protein of unknown function (DUF4239)